MPIRQQAINQLHNAESQMERKMTLIRQAHPFDLLSSLGLKILLIDWKCDQAVGSFLLDASQPRDDTLSSIFSKSA
jgi:hypothetical protein